MSLTFLDDIFSGGKKWVSKDENLFRIQSSFASLPTPASLPLEIHEKIFLALSSCLETRPNLWRFAEHYLVEDHPPFKRFINQNQLSLQPPPTKRNRSEPTNSGKLYLQKPILELSGEINLPSS
jgi:hypothetical protein